MLISKISPAAKTAGRYNIYVDGQYSFSLDEYQLVQLGLKSGLEINETTLEKFKSESEFGKNYIRAIDLISRRPRSIKEIRDYGFRKKWSKTNIDRVITRLLEKGYLNDQSFALAFAKSRQNMGKYSDKRIRLDLKNKGIDEQIIDITIKEINNTNPSAERDILKKIILKKQKRYTDENKLIAYLLRNGFRFDDIREVLTELNSTLD